MCVDTCRVFVCPSRPTELAGRLKDHPHIADTRIWPWSYLALSLLSDPNSLSHTISVVEMRPFEFCRMSEKQFIVQVGFDGDKLVPYRDENKFREQILFALWSGRLKHLAGNMGLAAATSTPPSERMTSTPPLTGVLVTA